MPCCETVRFPTVEINYIRKAGTAEFFSFICLLLSLLPPTQSRPNIILTRPVRKFFSSLCSCLFHSRSSSRPSVGCGVQCATCPPRSQLQTITVSHHSHCNLPSRNACPVVLSTSRLIGVTTTYSCSQPVIFCSLSHTIADAREIEEAVGTVKGTQVSLAPSCRLTDNPP